MSVFKFNPTPDCPSPYGASMGRRSSNWGWEPEPGERLYLVRVPLDRGGYDRGGAYWGHGQALWAIYCASCDETQYVRAGNREAAKNIARDNIPCDLRFYR